MIKEQPLQWHPAFFAELQIEMAADAHNLIFENEHQLGTKPKEIDILVIKKNCEIPLHSNLGKLFRKYNIIEYKSPTDYLNIDDFFKVYGYACFYKADTISVDTIKIQEISITFVCQHYPQKLMNYLKQMEGLFVERKESGIYYVIGDRFPIQFIITSQLSEKKNLWLKNLTNDIKSPQIARKLINEYDKHKDNHLYKSVMNIITNANRELFKEENFMCEAILDLAMEIYEERISEQNKLLAEKVQQMKEYEEQAAIRIKELEEQADKQKKELEEQADKRIKELEEQADKRKKELEEQADKRKKELEEQADKRKKELEEQADKRKKELEDELAFLEAKIQSKKSAAY